MEDKGTYRLTYEAQDVRDGKWYSLQHIWTEECLNHVLAKKSAYAMHKYRRNVRLERARWEEVKDANEKLSK